MIKRVATWLWQILYPLRILIAFIYYSILAVRRKAYASGLLKSEISPIPSIGIGNLEFGGTGKTPLTIYLCDLLHNNCRVAVVFRGYRSRKKGIVESADPFLWGDEPALIKFLYPDVQVVIHPDRFTATRTIMNTFSPDIIIYDDVFQYLRIKTHLPLLVTEFKNPFFNNSLFPLGTLRDIKEQCREARAVVFTYTPDPPPIPLLNNYKKIIEEKYGIKQSFFLSHTSKILKIEDWVNKEWQKALSAFPPDIEELVVCCGIANPHRFFVEVAGLSPPVCRLTPLFHRDHTTYTSRKISQLVKRIIGKGSRTALCITEKDAIKMMNFDALREITVYVVVSRFATMKDDNPFPSFVITAINNKL